MTLWSLPTFDLDSDDDGLADDWSVVTAELAAAPTPSRVAGEGGTFAQRLQYESVPGEDGSVRLWASSDELPADAKQAAGIEVDVQGSCPESWSLAVVVYAEGAGGEILGLSGWSGWRITPEWQRVSWIYYDLPTGTERVWAGLAVNGIVGGEGAFDIALENVLPVTRWIAVTAEIVARIAPPRLTARLQERHLDLHVFAAERSTP